MWFKIFCVVCMVIFSTSVFASDASKGEINWEGGYVIATGIGVAPAGKTKAFARMAAEKAAKVDAQRNLLEIIKGVKVTAETTVENMMLVSDVVKTNVEGLLKGAVQIDRKFEQADDGSVSATVTMKVCITASCSGSKSLIGAFDPKTLKEDTRVPPKSIQELKPEQFVKPVEPAPAVPQVPTPAPVHTAPVMPPQAPQPPQPIVVYDQTKPVTGVIFSLNGLPFEKELLPVVATTDAQGNLVTVYSVKNVKPEVVRTHGIVRYAADKEHATKITHIGNNAMLVIVSKVQKDNTIIIAPEGAKAIRETTMHGNNYLQDAKVVIANK